MVIRLIMIGWGASSIVNHSCELLRLLAAHMLFQFLKRRAQRSGRNFATEFNSDLRRITLHHGDDASLDGGVELAFFFRFVLHRIADGPDEAVCEQDA